MAFYGQQRKMAEGQFTQTIYGLIRDQKFAEAIQHLNIELQVGKALQNPFHIRMSLLPRSLLRAHPMLHCSNSPTDARPFMRPVPHSPLFTHALMSMVHCPSELRSPHSQLRLPRNQRRTLSHPPCHPHACPCTPSELPREPCRTVPHGLLQLLQRAV